jgi:hypothetical protein
MPQAILWAFDLLFWDFSGWMPAGNLCTLPGAVATNKGEMAWLRS